MINAWRYGDDARRDDAAAWVVRLEAGDLGDAEAVTFDAWLSATPENAVAFDAALSVSHAYAAAGDEVSRNLSDRRVAPRIDRRRAVVGFGAMAAAAALAVVAVPQFAGPDTDSYITAKGQHRTVQLADGSTIDLNGGTRLTVNFARDGRHVNLAEGQAVFDVAHDARRPFLVAVGDRTVRVVGTQFDVRRLGGKLSVTVARGAVEVRPVAGVSGKAYRLHPGQRLDHVEGAVLTRVAQAEPAEVLGWRSGRMVYRQQPLSDVIDDLNQQFTTQIRIEDPELAATPISGVLVMDDQASVIRRLALLVPITAVRSGAGLALRRDTASVR
ncbi:MAG: FecR domain-containing protein [Alphaproteobacteria bacterium]|nr:FecR domain-containing protein [Alphaproteobacteria bacterium]MBU1516848.1 FecR domain-containing protein [Alphaproteobacteria bacterium]MBU2092542.1 FecR domain-containing protein [Alphaproteobacteria bacterium]MBU2309649.1 FecR domain-containing protein [Alphaproteobacteria bacterium]MBU2365862.1 FecR domain-containing protein [Alphaproteobacteria bacterium]